MLPFQRLGAWWEFKNVTTLQLVTGTVQRIVIVFDEGKDASGVPTSSVPRSWTTST